MSYKCVECGTYLFNYDDRCTNCESRAAAERQANKITSAIHESTAASQRQAQALQDMLSGVERAHALQLQLENEKSTSNEAAYNAGFSLSWIEQDPEAFIGSLNDIGQITTLDYTNPYQLDRLKNAFSDGLSSRLRSEIGNDLKIAGAQEYFIEEAYLAGSLGKKSVRLQLKEKKPDKIFINWLIDCKISTKEYRGPHSPYLYDDSTAQFRLNPASNAEQFESELVRLAFLRGIRDFIEKQNKPESVAARISERRSQNILWAIPVLLCLASLYLGYLSWQSGHWIRAWFIGFFGFSWSFMSLLDRRYLMVGLVLAFGYANHFYFRF